MAIGHDVFDADVLDDHLYLGLNEILLIYSTYNSKYLFIYVNVLFV